MWSNGAMERTTKQPSRPWVGTARERGAYYSLCVAAPDTDLMLAVIALFTELNHR